MSYSVYDARGYVAELASNNGVTALAKVVKKHAEAPALQAFFRDGYTTAPKEVANEIAALEADQQIADTERHTLSLLRASMLKAREVAIIKQ